MGFKEGVASTSHRVLPEVVRQVLALFGLLEIVRSLRDHLESLRYFDAVKSTIAKLIAWEQKFYAVQQDELKQVPKALAELDARLAKVLVTTGCNKTNLRGCS